MSSQFCNLEGTPPNSRKNHIHCKEGFFVFPEKRLSALKLPREVSLDLAS